MEKKKSFFSRKQILYTCSRENIQIIFLMNLYFSISIYVYLGLDCGNHFRVALKSCTRSVVVKCIYLFCFRLSLFIYQH